MTQPTIRLKVRRTSVIKGKALIRFPANVAVEDFITLAIENGIYTFGVDYNLIGAVPISDPTTAMVVVLDETSGTYKLQSLSSLLASSAQIVQTFTAGGTEAINANTGIALVNQTVGAAKTLTMPLSTAKTCPVLISDFKGDAGTNPITINLSGSDKFPGNVTSWSIFGNTGSIFLRPIPGVGYAL